MKKTVGIISSDQGLSIATVCPSNGKQRLSVETQKSATMLDVLTAESCLYSVPDPSLVTSRKHSFIGLTNKQSRQAAILEHKTESLCQPHNNHILLSPIKEYGNEHHCTSYSINSEALQGSLDRASHLDKARYLPAQVILDELSSMGINGVILIGFDNSAVISLIMGSEVIKTRVVAWSQREEHENAAKSILRACLSLERATDYVGMPMLELGALNKHVRSEVVKKREIKLLETAETKNCESPQECLAALIAIHCSNNSHMYSTDLQGRRIVRQEISKLASAFLIATLGSCLLISGMNWIEIDKIEKETLNIKTETSALFSKVLPNTPMVDPVRQLAQLKNSNSNDDTLGFLSSVTTASKNLNLTVNRFSSNKSNITIEGTAKEFGLPEKLVDKLLEKHPSKIISLKESERNTEGSVGFKIQADRGV